MRFAMSVVTLGLAGIAGTTLEGCSGASDASAADGAPGSPTAGNVAIAGASGALTTGGAPAATGGDSGAPNVGGDAGSGQSGGSAPLPLAGAASSGGASSGAGGSMIGGGGAGGLSGGSAGSVGGAANSGICTASKPVNANATGSGPHQVVVETNSDRGIDEGTIFRPKDLGGAEKYPIFVWGEGGCSRDGLSNSAAMAEIASHGYFVIADGVPNGNQNRPMDESNPVGMGKPLIGYIDWAIEENGKACSAYHDSLDVKKVASNGFSCGGLMSLGTGGDPRMTTWGINSSGLFGANQTFYETIHTPVLIVLGGSSDTAYANGQRDFTNISPLGIPIMLFSKNIGHGGDLFGSRGGDFTKINLAWLNWWLKGDESTTGKGVLVGAGCGYCKDGAWEVKSANLP